LERRERYIVAIDDGADGVTRLRRRAEFEDVTETVGNTAKLIIVLGGRLQVLHGGNEDLETITYENIR